MKDFDQILDECIHALMSGTATLEECLRRYPVEAPALEPLLRSAVGLRSIHSVHPSPTYKARARHDLKRHMQTHPRRGPAAPRLSPVARIAFSLTLLLLALTISGTAFAQGSLPGDSFYSWKLTSERVWRAVSPDPVGTDLILADRRMQEYLTLSSDPEHSERSGRALQGYKEVLARLSSESDERSRGRIESVLQGHEKSLQNSGVSVPVLDEYLAKDKPKKDPGTNNGKGPDKPEHPTPDHPQPNPQGQGQGQP